MSLKCSLLVPCLLLACYLATVTARSPTCMRQCPADCGQRKRADGCLDCLCGQVFHGGPSSNSRYGRESPPLPPPPPIPTCYRPCPQDCGMTKDSNGCNECHCDVNPFFRPTPPRPVKSQRISDDEKAQKCRQACPQDCGCLVDDNSGKATCHCGNNPLIRTVPPRPPRPHSSHKK